MINKLTKKILAGLILTVFSLSNTVVLAADKPTLRASSGDPKN